MNFKEALTWIFNNRKNDREIFDPFLLYSRLSDLCSSSFDAKKKVLTFYQIDREQHLFLSLMTNRVEFKEDYDSVSHIVSKSAYDGLIATLKSIIDQGTSIKTQSVKRYGNAKVFIASRESETETRTPLNSQSFISSSSVDIGSVIVLFVAGSFILTTVLLVILGSIFDWKWDTWQWIIGITGGIVLFFTGSVTVAAIHEKGLLNFFNLGCYVIGAAITNNLLLLICFKQDYRIMFGCFSIGTFISSLFLSCFMTGNEEKVHKIIHIVQIPLSIVLMIIGLIFT